MLCECIPVGTNVGGIPTAVKGIWFLVEYGDVDALVSALQTALQCDESIGKKARAHISETFTLKRREEALLRVIRGTKQ